MDAVIAAIALEHGATLHRIATFPGSRRLKWMNPLSVSE